MVNLQEMIQKLGPRLNELNGKKVFIFGDIGIDEYVEGQVARISPEAPVPVVEVSSTESKLGLSGNVAANVKSLGGTPLLFSLVGEDTKAEDLRHLLSEKGISSDHLMIDPSRKTTTKLRVMSGQHHVVRVDYESRVSVSEEILQKALPGIEQSIAESDAVIIQDYAKGLISQHSCQKVIEIAKKLNKPVMVDPYRSTPLSWYKGADFMTPNRDEALDLAKQIPQPEIWDNVDLIGPKLMESINSPTMVITLGSEGVKIFEDQGIFPLPTFARKVFDVTGAGDTVIAAYSLGTAAGWDIRETAFFANMAAGVVVGQIGAVACEQKDLLEFLKEHA